MEINDKPIIVRNQKAARLVSQRAIAEGRSKSNAAARTIIEALGDTAGQNQNDTDGGPSEQDKNSA